MASCSRMPGQPGPKHHVHDAGRRRFGVKVDQRDAQRLARLGLPVGGLDQPVKADAPAAAGACRFRAGRSVRR